MSGMSLAMAGCLAGQRDWRRVTVGNNSARYGYDVSTPYGAINFATFQGATIRSFGAQSSTNFELILSGTLVQTFFNFIEVGLANGQSRFFYPGAASAFSHPATNTQWDWNGLPAGYTWGAADVGAVRFIGIG
jgi:hypothetical protein